MRFEDFPTAFCMTALLLYQSIKLSLAIGLEALKSVLASHKLISQLTSDQHRNPN